MSKTQPLNVIPVKEIRLLQAPLERVISQVRFPTILGIRDPDKIAQLQEVIRESYPIISQETVQSVHLGAFESPDIRPHPIWRFTDSEVTPEWRVSLGVDFVSLETTNYKDRNDYLERLFVIISEIEQTFKPASASRFGLRYINRLSDEAVECIAELLQPEILGILQPSGCLNKTLQSSVISQFSEVQFLAKNDTQITGRWGKVSNTNNDANGVENYNSPSWVLDLDMYTTKSNSFNSRDLQNMATDFSEQLYWVFRQMVTKKFLKFYGGKL